MPPRARPLVLGLLARAREAGTPASTTARRDVARFLCELGYQVHEQSFRFNAGVYRAFPAVGAVLSLGSLGLTPLLLRPSPPWAPAVALVAMAVLATVVGVRALRGDGGPAAGREDANLIASRPLGTVRYWLVAHLDTKAQAQSMAGRLWTVWVTATAAAGLAVIAVVRLLGMAVPALPVAAVVVLGAVAGLLLAAGRLAGASPGARDNGSGLMAVLTAAELSADASIGVIITGAEEFGLVGARALARERPSLFEGTTIVNVDTVDDEGTLFIVMHGPASRALAGRALERVEGLSPVTHVRRLPLGIMVDGVPLSRVALETVTLARLSWDTLRRVHTPLDHAQGYQLATAERLGERLARPI